MNCPRCKRTLAMGDTVCPECGYNTGRDSAYQSLRSRVIGGMKKQFSSPLFLAFAIILSILTVAYAVFAFEVMAAMPLFSVAVLAAAVCTAISAAFSFILYFSKGEFKASGVKKLNIYYTAMLLISVMELIFAGIVSGLALIVCLIMSALLLFAKNATETIEKLFGAIELGELSINEMLDGGSAIIAIGGVIISALVIFVFVCKVLAFKKSGKYVRALATLFESEEYSVKHAPSVGLWMYAVISLLISVIGFAFGIGCGIAFIMSGALMIVSALFFARMHKCSAMDAPADAADTAETVNNIPVAQEIPTQRYAQPAPQYRAPAPQGQPTQGYAPYQPQGGAQYNAQSAPQYRAPAPQGQPTQGYAPYQPQGGAQYNAQSAPQYRAPAPQGQPTQGYAPQYTPQPTQGYTPYQAQPMQGYAPYQAQPAQGYAPYQSSPTPETADAKAETEAEIAPETVTETQTAPEIAPEITAAPEIAPEITAEPETNTEPESVADTDAPEAQSASCDECESTDNEDNA